MISGGTLQSVAAAASDDDAAVISDPACLVDDPTLATAIRRASPLSVAPRRGPGGVVVAPIAPAGFINPPVIQRSFALRAAEAGRADAEPFRYREGIAISGPAVTMPLRYAVAGALSAPQVGFLRLAEASPQVRRRVGAGLERVLPSSGFGPASDRLEPWHWRMSVTARTTGDNELTVEVDGKGHPGYLTTARMLGEAGLMLAEEGTTPKRSGCLTPATALGSGEVDRFRRAGLTITVAEGRGR
jgi:short subunit dehydrogenase-like uncharacterized protein